jgi:hypothetical protein
VPNHVQVVGGGRCLVSFTPEQTKPHLIDIKFNGETVTGWLFQFYEKGYLTNYLLNVYPYQFPILQHKTCKIACACWVIFCLHNLKWMNEEIWTSSRFLYGLNLIEIWILKEKFSHFCLSVNTMKVQYHWTDIFEMLSAVLSKWSENGNSETTLLELTCALKFNIRTS